MNFMAIRHRNQGNEQVILWRFVRNHDKLLMHGFDKLKNDWMKSIRVC